MKSNSCRYPLLIAALLYLLCMVACTQQDAPEKEIYSLLATVVEKAEAKDLASMRKVIADTYRDANGLTKQDIIRILASYFIRNASINVQIRIDSLSLADTGKSADAVVYAAVAGIPLSEYDIRLAQAEIHRFSIVLEKTEKKWKVASIHWQRSSVEDFLTGPTD